MDDGPLGASPSLAPPHPALPRPTLLRPAPHGSAAPRRPAVPRSEPPRPRYVRVLDSTDSMYIGFYLFVLPKKPPRLLCSVPWRSKTTSFPGRAALPRPRPTPPRPAAPPRRVPPCSAVPSPARGMSGFWIRQEESRNTTSG